MTRTFTFYLAVFLIILTQANGWAQIGMGGTPHPSAVLDLKSPNNNKAFYPPRLTSTQRLAIPNPQAGALVYDTDKGTLYLHNGQNWLPLAFTDSSQPTDPGLPTSVSLTASDGTAGDLFGTSVAVSGDYALVGAFSKNINGKQAQGAVYVFMRSGNTWIQQQRLTASDGDTNNYFGTSVAIEGDYALIGAAVKTLGGNGAQGAAYVFVRSGNNWVQQQRITASDGSANEYFGISVAISGEYALVGVYNKTVGDNFRQGAAYVFVRSGSSWTQQQRLTASDGAANDRFGYSVAISGEYALVGAYANNSDQGAAYVFMRSGTTWSQQQRLTASDGVAGDRFGYSVDISGEYALIGAYQKSIGNNGSQGAAYVFMRSGSSWNQQQRLIASDGAASDQLGISVAISGEYALVGAVGKSISSVAAYVFMRSGSNWSQQQRLADDSRVEVWNGTSVGLSNRTYIIGGTTYQNSRGKAVVGAIN